MIILRYFFLVLILRLAYQVGSGALIPMELCMVPPGQIMRKQVPPEKTKDVLEFATKRPEDRLASIRNGLAVRSGLLVLCNIYLIHSNHRSLHMDNLNMSGSLECSLRNPGL
jgi:hypothetical protein